LPALAITLQTVLARAQSSEPSARSAAVDMFDAGNALLESGQIEAACPKYAESYRLDPQLGALLHWADCLEQDGKLASAYAAFRDAIELAERSADQRGEFAAARAASLAPRLNRVVIAAPTDGLPQGANIQLDSLTIVRSGLGVGIAVDSGEHRVRVSAPGYVPFSATLTVSGEGQTQRVVLPRLERVPPSAPALALPAAAPPAVVMKPSRNEQKWLGAGVGGAGVIALGVGGFFLARMLHALDQRDDLCPRDPCSTNVDRSRVRAFEGEARTAEAWGLGLAIGGAVAVVSGVVLYLHSPSDSARLSAWQTAANGAAKGLEWRF
jgi:hypothetical protein